MKVNVSLQVFVNVLTTGEKIYEQKVQAHDHQHDDSGRPSGFAAIDGLCFCRRQPDGGWNGGIFPEGAEARRGVVALSRSIGDLWLLAGGTLSGITSDGLDLDGITKDCVSVGTISAPNAEAIMELQPDEVLATEEIPAQKKVVETLTSAGISCRDVRVNSFTDYEQIMKKFTELTGRQDLYMSNVEEVAEAIDELRDSAPAAVRGKSFLLIRASATKTKALKDDHFVATMLTDLGLVNVAADGSSLDDLSLEWIIEKDPAYIFVVTQGSTREANETFKESFLSQPAWNQLSAVRGRRLFILEKDLFQYKPNNRWAQAYQVLLDDLTDGVEGSTEG